MNPKNNKYLICYGTRPEIIKIFPLINTIDKHITDIGRQVNYLTLFSGQHIDLFEQYKNLLPYPDFVLDGIMEKGQTLNKLYAKILMKMDEIFNNNNNKYKITHVIVQGDTTTACAIAQSAFHHKIKVVHLEAGLRTFDKYSPFPEEINRSLISKLADIHLCPTKIAINNLKKEAITNNVYLVGNTIVDSFKYVLNNCTVPGNVSKLFDNKGTVIENSQNKHYLVTLHRRENRDNILELWKQLKYVADSTPNTTFIYIKHHSLIHVTEHLNHPNIKLIDPVDYVSMVFLINKCDGIISDSGGLQEEAVCAGKKVLVCRHDTERPETIESGFGMLTTNIKDNMDFLLTTIIDDENTEITINNPYGENVCEKILDIIGC